MTQKAADRFYIAITADPQSNGAIFGIGLSDEAAVADAHKCAGTQAPVVTKDGPGNWIVTYGNGERRRFPFEEDADAFASERGFKASECTERLYRYVETHSLDSWTCNAAGLDDLDVDQALVDAAVAEVRSGFEGTSASPDTTTETALQDAHDYVDAYVMDDETVDEDLREAIDEDAELRTAIDVAVKQMLLDDLAEREAA